MLFRSLLNHPTLAFSHRVQKSVLYICVSFACSVSHIGSSLPSFYIFPYICVNILYWCFSFWLTSLCIIGSGFIHLIRMDSNVFFLMTEYYSTVYMYQSTVGEGNGNPLQCSCLENPRDRGAWWTAICGVAQSRTRLKQISSSSSILY